MIRVCLVVPAFTTGGQAVETRTLMEGLTEDPKVSARRQGALERTLLESGTFSSPRCKGGVTRVERSRAIMDLHLGQPNWEE